MLLIVVSRFLRIVYACDIPLGKGNIGKNVFLAHNGLGIVISSESHIGDNCTIYQNTTIGAGHGGYPIIGNNVTIYANTVIAGKIIIGDNAVIGASSFVNTDVPANAVFAGVSAKNIRQ